MNGRTKSSASIKSGAPLKSIAASIAISLAGVVLIFVHQYGGTPGDPEGWFASLGFAAPFLAAGLLALTGTILQRPELTIFAAMAVIPMSIVSVVLFPLLIPAIVLIAQAGAKALDQPRLIVPAILATALVAVFVLLVFHQDPATWSTPDGGGGSSSNIITTTEASLSIAVAVSTCLVGLAWARTERSPK